MVSADSGIDPNHLYSHKTGYEGVYNYWYVDIKGDYWEYTNAPSDSDDYCKVCGPATIVRFQPNPTERPRMFSDEGKKLSIEVPEDVDIEFNTKIDLEIPSEAWYCSFNLNNTSYKVYYDSYIKENLPFWFRHNVRAAGSNLRDLRLLYTSKFLTESDKDKALAVCMALIDQGCFTPEALNSLLGADLSFDGRIVVLKGKKIVCDNTSYAYFTYLKTTRRDEDPLFAVLTYEGLAPVGSKLIRSSMSTVGITPEFLVSWRVNQVYAAVYSRLQSTENEGNISVATISEVSRYTGIPVKEVAYYLDDLLVSVLETSELVVKAQSSSTEVFSLNMNLSYLLPEEEIFNSWFVPMDVGQADVEGSLPEFPCFVDKESKSVKCAINSWEYPIYLARNSYFGYNNIDRSLGVKKSYSNLVVSDLSLSPEVVSLSSSNTSDFLDDVPFFVKDRFPTPGSLIEISKGYYSLVTADRILFINDKGKTCSVEYEGNLIDSIPLVKSKFDEVLAYSFYKEYLEY